MMRVLGMWVGADVDPLLFGAGWTVHRKSLEEVAWADVARRDVVVARLDADRLAPFVEAWGRRRPPTRLVAVVDSDIPSIDVIALLRVGASDVLVAPVDEQGARDALARLNGGARGGRPLVDVARSARADDLPFAGDGAMLLPTLWQALMRPDGDMDAVVDIIGRSPRLTARTIQAANLANFRSSRPARSLRDASVRLGVRNLALVAHDASLAAAYEVPKHRTLGSQLWRNATACTRGAAAIARLAKDVDPYITQLYALLHNVGEIAILSRVCNETVQGSDDVGFEKRLTAVIAEEHAAVGARILDELGAPAGIRQFTECHHDSARLTELGTSSRVAYAVLVAWELAHDAGFSYPRHDHYVRLDSLCAALGITEAAARDAFHAVHEGVS